MARPVGVDADESATIATKYAGGMTLAQLAGEHGITVSAVRYHVLKNGGTMRPRGRRAAA